MMKWLFAVIVFMHGLIHLMGGVNELGLAKIEELSDKTLFLIPSNMQTILGVFWFITVAMFLITVVGLVTNKQWWKTIAFGAVIISQVLILIWWPAAKWGTIPNVLILLAAFMLKL